MIQNRGSNMVDNASSSPVNNNHVIMTSLLLLNFIYVLERILILSLRTFTLWLLYGNLREKST